MKKILIIPVVLLLAGISCTKIDSIPVRYTAIPDTNTNLKFLMMSPDAPPVNFFVNNVKSSAILAPTSNIEQGMVYPSVFPATAGYVTLRAGSLKIDAISAASSTTSPPGTTIFSSTHALEAKKFYTLAIADSVSKITSVLVEDDPSVPDLTKSYIRVANLVSNTSSVSIEVLKTSAGSAYSKDYLNFPFKSFSSFEMLDAGAGETYRFTLKNSATGAVLSTLTVTPVASKKYTVLARGVLGLAATDAKRPLLTFYTNF